MWHKEVPLSAPAAAQAEVLCTDSECRSDKPLIQVPLAAAHTWQMSEVTGPGGTLGAAGLFPAPERPGT